MWRLDMPIADYETDLKSVLDRTVPLIQAVTDVLLKQP